MIDDELGAPIWGGRRRSLPPRRFTAELNENTSAFALCDPQPFPSPSTSCEQFGELASVGDDIFYVSVYVCVMASKCVRWVLRDTRCCAMQHRKTPKRADVCSRERARERFVALLARRVLCELFGIRTHARCACIHGRCRPVGWRTVYRLIG